MLKRPRGEKRPADVTDAVAQVMRIATGEAKDTVTEPPMLRRWPRSAAIRGQSARDG